jgi:DNA (cytosine-5)-methyltransferase 1
VAGGFPCQPVSVAGKRLAQADHRWLWPEFARAIRALRPRYVLVENVPGLLVRGFGDVLRDLAACGYDAEWDCVSAADVGAPHLRRRVFIIAYTISSGCSAHDGERTQPIRARPSDNASPRAGDCCPLRVHRVRDEPGRRNGQDGADSPEPRNDGAAGNLPNSNTEHGNAGRYGTSPVCREQSCKAGVFDMANPDGNGKLQPSRRIGAQWGRPGHCDWWDVEPDVGRVAHGVPSRVDRLRALGNAVVPQCAEVIGRMIMAKAVKHAMAPKGDDHE